MTKYRITKEKIIIWKRKNLYSVPRYKIWCCTFCIPATLYKKISVRKSPTNPRNRYRKPLQKQNPYDTIVAVGNDKKITIIPEARNKGI